MIDSRVGVRRYLRATVAATVRSECLGLIVLAVRPDDLDAPPDWDALLSPYLGLVRPVAAGCEGGGVALPEGARVLADGLETRCWPGAESDFREELVSPAVVDREPCTPQSSLHSGGVGGRALSEIVQFFGIGPEGVPAAVVLDPAPRRGVIMSLPEQASVWAMCRALVEEVGGWPWRRLAVVETLLTARMEHAAMERPHDPEIARVQEQFGHALGGSDDHSRAVLLARCSDELRTLESSRPGHSRENGGRSDGRSDSRSDRRERLRATVAALRDELERGDRACSPVDAAVRAAHAELGTLRSATIAAPERLADWRFDRLWTPGRLSRIARKVD